MIHARVVAGGIQEVLPPPSPAISTMTLVKQTQEGPVEITLPGPVDVFCDTSVWRSLSPVDLKKLQSLKSRHGLRYRFSIVSFVELISHFEDQPFARVKSWFSRINQLCEPEILPSPEWEFLNSVGLIHYIDRAWIPDTRGIATLLKVLSRACSLTDVPKGLLNIGHYRKLREIDETSFQKSIEGLRDFIGQGPVKHEDSEKIITWFAGTLANFFLLIRPSGGKISYRQLEEEEKRRFRYAFTSGPGLLFFAHCTAVVKDSVRPQKKVDLNHLYDSLQLLLVSGSRLFVTKDNLYFSYPTLDPQVQRVISLDDLLAGV